jgi:hypothetical protein
MFTDFNKNINPTIIMSELKAIDRNWSEDFDVMTVLRATSLFGNEG